MSLSPHLILISSVLVFISIPTLLSAQTSTSEAKPTVTRTSNLITSNPFAPKQNSIIKKPVVTTTKNKQGTLEKYLQFKSIAIIDGKKYFSIFNRRQNKSYWIPEGESVDSISVSNYNPTTNTVSITDGVNRETFSIISADEKPLNVVSAVPNNPGNKDIKNTQPTIPKATTTDTSTAKKPIPRRRVVSTQKK